jgi:ABC-type polysaccharide/polyol phosphate export permease
MAVAEAGSGSVMRLDSHPGSLRAWIAEIWERRSVLGVLSRADFQGRYKRTSFGIAWSVVVPLVQALVLTIIFARITGVLQKDFGAYVLAGVLGWTYFSQSVQSAATSIVDGAALTDKVWFPRAILPTVPLLSNLPGLLATMAFLVVALPLLGGSISVRLLLLPAALLLLILFTWALALVLSALHVYFRDIRYLLQAALLMWFYITPVVYPQRMVGKFSALLDLNPLTGIVTLLRLATVGATDWVFPVTISAVSTLVLIAIGIEVHRRHDRLFVDLL